MTAKKHLVVSVCRGPGGRATIEGLSSMESPLETLPKVTETEFLDLYARARVRRLRIKQVPGGWVLVFDQQGRGDATIATARKTLKVWKSVDTLIRFLSVSTGVKEIHIKLE